VATNEQLLSQKFLRLRNADPVAFDDCVSIFGEYTGEVTVAVTEADATNILVMQGRAQQCRAILRVLQECDKPKQTKPAPLSP
jgi:type II secretory pathway component GspD/PulD (secretin)